MAHIARATSLTCAASLCFVDASVQEIRDSSETALPQFVAALNENVSWTGRQYNYTVGLRHGSSSSKEQYGAFPSLF